jgi:hypothetical protein
MKRVPLLKTPPPVGAVLAEKTQALSETEDVV